MSRIKLFENFLITESISDNFYELFDDIVYVYDTEYSGGEYIVYYKKEDTSKGSYRGTSKEIDEDFIRTSKEFSLTTKPITTTRPAIKKAIPKKAIKPEYFDIVFKIGNKKIETIQYKVYKSHAYALKNFFQKKTKYNRGSVILEPNIVA